MTNPIVPNHTLRSPSPGRRRLRLRCRRSPVVRLRLLRRRPHLQSWRRVRLVHQLVRLHRRRVRTDRVGSDEPQSALESVRVHQDRARQLARSRQQDQRRSEVQGARIGPGPAIERPLRGRFGAKTNTIKTISQHPTCSSVAAPRRHIRTPARNGLRHATLRQFESSTCINLCYVRSPCHRTIMYLRTFMWCPGVQNP